MVTVIDLRSGKGPVGVEGGAVRRDPPGCAGGGPVGSGVGGQVSGAPAHGAAGAGECGAAGAEAAAAFVAGVGRGAGM